MIVLLIVTVYIIGALVAASINRAHDKLHGFTPDDVLTIWLAVGWPVVALFWIVVLPVMGALKGVNFVVEKLSNGFVYGYKELTEPRENTK